MALKRVDDGQYTVGSLMRSFMSMPITLADLPVTILLDDESGKAQIAITVVADEPKGGWRKFSDMTQREIELMKSGGYIR